MPKGKQQYGDYYYKVSECDDVYVATVWRPYFAGYRLVLTSKSFHDSDYKVALQWARRKAKKLWEQSVTSVE